MLFRLTLFFIFLFSFCDAQEIIPLPNQYEQKEGNYTLPDKVTVSANDKEFAGLIPEFIRKAHDFYTVRVKKGKNNGTILLIRDPQIREQEAYRLTVKPERITIEAGSAKGCFYGLQSAIQLLNQAAVQGSVPCAFIQDQPAWSWRGLMLDESRHFLGMTEVKRLLDFMALQKLNKFHWHLTDGSGWRIEIKQYPLLARTGGKGDLTHPDGPAMYYTQKEIREIVNYAKDRFIEVIPEIDMPGHATAAVKAYPEFNGGGSEQYPNFTFNPGKDGTYGFLTNILKEITRLFPSPYIHIGGDEVHFGNQNWNNLQEVKELMQNQQLKDLVGVEHYFLNRMADSVRVMGKTVIGWDEVVTAGLPSSGTTVMWWRHEKPKQLAEAIQKGYDIILCPRIPLYFDFVQDGSHAYGRKWPDGAYAPIETVYRFPDPSLTGGISVSAPQVKGMQANVWTERIHTPERLQFMVFPRLSALAEAGWTEARLKDFDHFNSRMNFMMALYKKTGVRFFDYRHPETTPEIPGPVK
jgi:hexosaminidase